MTTESDTSFLKCIFMKILRDGLKYCSLCFHTSDERRLVEPHYLKLYFEAAKIRKGSGPLAACYICERRSKHALKALQHARFVASIRVILEVLLRRHISDARVIFNKNYFSKLVKTAHLEPSRFTPALVQRELQAIRADAGGLSHSNAEIVDNNSHISRCNDSVVGMSCRKKYRRPAGDSGAAPDTPSAPQGLHKTQKGTPSPQAAQEQNFIPSNMYLLTKLDILGPGADPAVPKVVTMQDITEHCQEGTANYVLHPVFKTGLKKYSVPSMSAEITNKTIFYHDAHRNIIAEPLEFDPDIIKKNFLSGPLASAPQTQKAGSLATSDSCQINVTDGLMSNRVVVLEESNVVVFCNSGNKNEDLAGKVISCRRRSSASPAAGDAVKAKRMKPDVSTMCVTDPRPRISGVTFSEFSSDMDGVPDQRVATDWEDKIPMDVISFVDAVDPNADEVFIRQVSHGVPFCDIQIGEPRSLADSDNEFGVHSDIIDLSET